MTPVIIKQHMVVAQVIFYTAIPNFQPFALTATVDGQLNFELPSVPTAIILLAINGITQSELNGDFTVAGDIITLNQGVDAGTLIAGIYV